MSQWQVKFDVNWCRIKVFSREPSMVYIRRVCKIGSFWVSSLNCSKLSLLIGRFEIKIACDGWGYFHQVLVSTC